MKNYGSEILKLPNCKVGETKILKSKASVFVRYIS